jgi:hypothetical protein
MRHLAISGMGLVLVGLLAGCGSGSSPTQSTSATLAQGPTPNGHNCGGEFISVEAQTPPFGNKVVAPNAHNQQVDNIFTGNVANCGQNNGQNP